MPPSSRGLLHLRRTHFLPVGCCRCHRLTPVMAEEPRCARQPPCPSICQAASHSLCLYSSSSGTASTVDHRHVSPLVICPFGDFSCDITDKMRAVGTSRSPVVPPQKEQTAELKHRRAGDYLRSPSDTLQEQTQGVFITRIQVVAVARAHAGCV